MVNDNILVRHEFCQPPVATCQFKYTNKITSTLKLNSFPTAFPLTAQALNHALPAPSSWTRPRAPATSLSAWPQLKILPARPVALIQRGILQLKNKSC
jgi:hypothetical protein